MTVLDTTPIAPLSTATDMERLSFVTRHCFQLQDKEAAELIASVGEVKLKKGKAVLVPCRISSALYAVWQRAESPMPVWRLGGAVAVLEHFALEKITRFVHARVPADDPRMQAYGIGLEELHILAEQENLAGWVWKFRAALLKRLELDAKHDKEAKAQFVRYLAMIDNLKKEEFSG